MGIIFTGGTIEEFVGAIASENSEHFDGRYALYALGAPNDGDLSAGAMIASPLLAATNDFWLHFRVFTQNAYIWTGGTHYYGFAIYAGSTMLMNARAHGSYTNGFYPFGSATNLLAALASNFPAGHFRTVDIHIERDGVNATFEIYIEGIRISQITLAHTGQDPVTRVEFGNLFANPSGSRVWYSEIVMSTESTLGYRLASQLPYGPNELNQWTGGGWADLGTADPAEGVSVAVANRRIAGAFSAYRAPAHPLGVRAVVDSLRYVDHDALVKPQCFLRDGVGQNYDAPDDMATDPSRHISIWDVDPATEEVWTTAAISARFGGIISQTKPA